MITKTNAVNMSVRRWEALAQDEDAETGCGFCEFFNPALFDTTNKNCQNCPLYPDVCMNHNDDTGSLFYRHRREYISARRIELANRILTAIKERGAKWIKGEKK